MTDHVLGYKGHRQFKPHQLKALDDNNIRINHLGGAQYELIPTQDDVALDTICPSYVVHESGVIDRDNLIVFMDWLNQPSASFLSHISAKKQNDPANKTQRESLLSFMNFALSDRAQLQDKIREELEKETAECHAETEDAIRRNDEWITENEIGNADVFSCSLPNTSLNPAAGYSFDLDDNFLNAHDGLHQQKAQVIFWDSITKATDGRYKEPEKTITLSAKELENFYAYSLEHDLPELVEHVRFETAVQEKAEKIKDRARTLALGQAREPASTSPASVKQKLRDLLNATSSFTPIMQSEYLQNSWWRAHITESWFADKNDTPYEELAEEYAVFTALMQSYSKQAVLTPTQMQAITEEFYPLLITTEKARDIIEDAAQKAKMNVPEGVSAFKQAFNNASTTHMPVADKFLPEHHQEALDNLEHTLKTGPKAFLESLTTEPLKGGAEAGWDVTKDVWNYCTESPKQAALVITAGFALYMLSANTGVDANTLAANNDILMLTLDGMTAAPAPDSLSAEAAQSQSYHYDVGFSLKSALQDMLQGDLASPYYVYKHFTNYMMVEGTEWSMDTFDQAMQYTAEQMGLPGNDSTAFSAGAKSTMYGLAAFYFSLNLFQNFSHTGFWGWAGKKGFTHGGKGALRIVELASPLINPIYQAGLNIAELTPFKKKNSLSERLSNITTANGKPAQYLGHLDLETDTHQGSKPAVMALAEAAQIRTDIENTLPEHIKEAHIEMEIGGVSFGKNKRGALRRSFTIGAQNLAPTLKALSQFDHVLENMASHVGLDEPWYNAFLKQKIDTVSDALGQYQDSGNLAALQTSLRDNLQDVIGAEIRQSDGYSGIWQALAAGEEIDTKARKQLHRDANQTYGKLKRNNVLAEYRENQLLEDQSYTGHLLTRAKIAGVGLWHGLVGAARKLQNMDNVVPVLPTAIATAGTAAACVALDMFGMGNALTDIGSQAAGVVASSTIMTGIFVGYNWFIDDVIFVHLGTGAGLMVGGIAARMAYNQIKPLVATAGESQTLRKTAGAAFDGIRPLTAPIELGTKKAINFAKAGYKKLAHKNEQSGKKLTLQYREKYKDLYEDLKSEPPQTIAEKTYAPYEAPDLERL